MRSEIRRITMTGAMLALVLIPLTAADKPAPQPAHKPAAAAAVRSVWPPETLSGKISFIEPGRKLLVVKDQSGVPFDMVITSKTHIESGNKSLTLKDLSQDANKSVSVRFVPERRGDVAESVRIG
jgi:hypothetical protein